MSETGGHHGAPPPYDQVNPGQIYIGEYPQPPPPQQMVHSNVNMTQVAAGYGGNANQAKPHDYTTQAWIACLCCFWPTGILAIMKASRSREALARGDMVNAHEASRSARTMVRMSCIAGIVFFIIVAATGITICVFAVMINNSLNSSGP